MQKVRLDKLLVEKGLVGNIEETIALILEGRVLVEGIQSCKPGTYVKPGISLEILQKSPYVSRGGLKLSEALKYFDIDVKAKVAIDVGASTGGFTDCLLQSGVKKVYAVDVGYGQLAWELRNNPKVIVLERTNIRFLERGENYAQGNNSSRKLIKTVNDIIDIAAIDVSFISILKVIPKVLEFLTPRGEIIALIKPQFEAARKDVEKGGVLRNETKRKEIINKIVNKAKDDGLEVKGLMESPLAGPKGNREYFIYLKK